MTCTHFHKRLSPRRLRAATYEAIGMRADAQRVARAYVAAGGAPAAADVVDELLR